MTDIKWIVSCLNELKAHGVRIALDDFGTGYSSLNQLQQLPLDTLKIDRSFIEGLGDESERMNSVTATIASIADIYGLETVAEGIETEKQLLEVIKLGIDVAQGYYYSKPQPKDDVIATIDQINQLTRPYSTVDGLILFEFNSRTSRIGKSRVLRAGLTTKCFRFLKILESYNGGDDHYRGRDGELSVSDLRNPNAACAARLKAAVEYGLPLNPSFNAATTFGVGACQVIHTRKLLIHPQHIAIYPMS